MHSSRARKAWESETERPSADEVRSEGLEPVWDFWETILEMFHGKMGLGIGTFFTANLNLNVGVNYMNNVVLYHQPVWSLFSSGSYS